MKKHNIKVASIKSGLSPHVIRIWERRYGAVHPSRTDTNRRLYSDEDIERLVLLRKATRAGESISQIANLPEEELRKMISGGFYDNGQGNGGGTYVSETREADRYLHLCLEAVKRFDASLLQNRILDASVMLSRQTVLEKVLDPLLRQIGEMWSEGNLQVAHEHLASSVVRSILGSMVLTGEVEDSAPVFIATTPAGQHHEFGALMAAVTAAAMGWKVLYLGPNMPAENIANAVRQSHARAVALSIVYPPDDSHLDLELRKLHSLVGHESHLILGGRAVSGYRAVIDEIGAATINDLIELKKILGRLRSRSVS
jgi:DNA-binding transcriptional MerR regulator/methylmalonyl-CoA mutase cobalamin-binding subunit